MEHLLDNEAAKPSMVELIAQEQLKGLLRPSILYLLRWLQRKWPQFSIKYFEEGYLIVDLLLEGFLLRRHGKHKRH